MVSLVDKYSQSMSHDSCRRIGLVTTKAQRAFHTRPRKEGVASLGECCRLAKSLFVARTMPPSHVEEGRRGSKRPPSPRNVSRCECHPRTQRPGPKDPGGGFHRPPSLTPPGPLPGRRGREEDGRRGIRLTLTETLSLIPSPPPLRISPGETCWRGEGGGSDGTARAKETGPGTLDGQAKPGRLWTVVTDSLSYFVSS
jgi:hypothetical protein